MRAGHGKGTAVRRLGWGEHGILNQEKGKMSGSVKPHWECGADCTWPSRLSIDEF